ncbi:sensor domain-containing protein [Salinarimonas ramus]|uniref:PAS domain S-box-containing protein/diguanylate cyclase (GGDEF) domain-containing protein n=1 Tax=Salinarimonas ramus TaxID=690164 RepID=A0A917QHJ2_9HYPH|nr:EAL domain-containing protein [Salinarimonas ramus]GGK51063.1 hypothetical protein GCM10011322_42680 [Salinarimonas ramus]
MEDERRAIPASEAGRDVLMPSLLVGVMILIFAWTGWSQRDREHVGMLVLSELESAVGDHRALAIRTGKLLLRSRLEPHERDALATERAQIAAELAGASETALVLLESTEMAERERYARAVTSLGDRIGGALALAAGLDLREGDLQLGEAVAAAAARTAVELNRELTTKISRKSQQDTHVLQDVMALLTALVVVAYLALSVLPARARFIAEAKRLAELRDEVWTLSTIARKTQSAVIVTDALGRVTWVNEAFTCISGFGIEDVRGRTPGSVLQCEQTDARTVSAIRGALRNREPIRCEILNRASEGRLYWLDLDIQPLHDQRGTFTGFLAVESDVTERKTLLLAVEERNRDLETMSEIARIGVWTWSHGRFHPNFSAEAQIVLAGLCDRKSPRLALLAALPPARRRELAGHLLACARGEVPAFAANFPIGEPGGVQRWLRITARLDAQKGELIGSVQDVSDLVSAHREAHVAKTRLELAAHSARLGPFEWNLDSGIFWTGEAWWLNLGFEEVPKIDNLDSIIVLAHPADRADLVCAIEACQGDPARTLSAAFRMMIDGGEHRWVEIVARNTCDGGERVGRISGIMRDIHEERAAAEQALFAASHDLLTGLPNRAELKRRTASALEEDAPGGSVAVMLLDLDRFKAVNDTFGHATGDEVLVEVGARLRACVRDRDLVARLGGDEFAVLVRSERELEKDCAAICERIIEAVCRPISIGERRIQIGTSVGIAISGVYGHAPDPLLRNADAALYKAKASGKGQFCFFDEKLAAKEADRRVLQADLRDALERNELQLFYQPEIDLATGRVRAAEALLRWMHPEHGLVAPDRFIPIAEETGLIVPIGNWAIETACREAASWPDDVMVAVNLSAAQVGKVDLVSIVQNALADAGIAPSRLEIEVTESLFLTADPALLRDLEHLDAMGVRLALDDFGTGYSSLSYLQRLPFKRIKIDRSFVAGITEDPRAMAITKAVIDLAAALGIETTAEGVETSAQRRLLAEHGCTHAQGFLFGKPRPRIELPAAGEGANVVAGPWAAQRDNASNL